VDLGRLFTVEIDIFYLIKYEIHLFVVGLVRGNSPATIGGGIALGVSFVFSIILTLVFVYCLKNNNVNSNVHEQRPHQHQQIRHKKQHRQNNHEQNSSHQVTVISGMHKYDNNHHQQQQPYSSNGYGLNHFPPPVQNFGLADGKQLPQSPLKTSSLYFNQSNGLMLNQNQQANIKRDNYNRH
jgi:Na+-transporting methylmalonyl-CoA/oxaloacetate decarboxylase gamma subunit